MVLPDPNPPRALELTTETSGPGRACCRACEPEIGSAQPTTRASVNRVGCQRVMIHLRYSRLGVGSPTVGRVATAVLARSSTDRSQKRARTQAASQSAPDRIVRPRVP